MVHLPPPARGDVPRALQHRALQHRDSRQLVEQRLRIPQVGQAETLGAWVQLRDEGAL